MVSHAADDLLHSPLQWSPHLPGISQRRHDGRDAGEAGSRDGEDIGIKTIRMKDLNAMPSEQPGKFTLLFERAGPTQALDFILIDRDTVPLDLLRLAAPAPQTRQ